MNKLLYVLLPLLFVSCASKDSGKGLSDGESGTGATPVDMGLSVMWADRNVGAAAPGEAGLYVGFGDAGDNRSESPEDYRTFSDVASLVWGNGWRMPTEDEMQELIDRCTWIWVTDKNRRGYEITAPNGAKLFLPVTGLRLGEGFTRKKGFGGYWTSTSSGFSEDHARCLIFVPAAKESLRADSLKADIRKATFKMGDCMRQYGLAVRPVKK